MHSEYTVWKRQSTEERNRSNINLYYCCCRVAEMKRTMKLLPLMTIGSPKRTSKELHCSPKKNTKLPPINNNPMLKPGSLENDSVLPPTKPKHRNIRLPDVIGAQNQPQEVVTILGEVNRQRLRKVKRHFRDLDKAAGTNINEKQCLADEYSLPAPERVTFE